MPLSSCGSEYALFLDESGSQKPNPKDSAPFFALGGVLLKRQDEQVVESLISRFKSQWQIAPEVPLHGSEIRARKKRFAWLGKRPQAEQEKFFEDLTDTITRCPVVVHACVVSRSGYLGRYLDRYGENTWQMTKSAFSILVERAAKFAAIRNSSIMVYYEEAGKVEDDLMEQYFRELRTSGHPFNPATASKYNPAPAQALSELLRGIEGKQKSNAVLQLADLCLYPVVRSRDQADNRAYNAMKDAQMLADCHLEVDQIKSIGIKYYCFDSI